MYNFIITLLLFALYYNFSIVYHFTTTQQFYIYHFITTVLLYITLLQFDYYICLYHNFTIIYHLIIILLLYITLSQTTYCIPLYHDSAVTHIQIRGASLKALKSLPPAVQSKERVPTFKQAHPG